MINIFPEVVFKTRVRERSWRYAALIDNKIIKKLWMEEGFGDNTSRDSYGKSSPENILKDLNQL